jgi:pepF/M3 family oligoendopeptidase
VSTATTEAQERLDELPRWSVTDLYESLGSREFRAGVEQARADVARAAAVFDRHEIRGNEPRQVTEQHGLAADAAIAALNDLGALVERLGSYVYATVSTDSRDEQAQSLFAEVLTIAAGIRPLVARLAAWVSALYAASGGSTRLAAHSAAAAEHAGPLLRLAARAAHQMNESEEGLYAELSTVASTSWANLQSDVTSQLSVEVELPAGTRRLPMPAVRGLANDGDPHVRRAAYDAEMVAWPQVAVSSAAAMNAIKGEATIVNRRRKWDNPLDASLFANAVSRSTFDAMQAAVADSLDDFRRWMRTKATLHGGRPGAALQWSDLVAPCPVVPASMTWDEGVATVRDAFAEYSTPLGGLVTRALAERWIDAGPRDGKTGGAFCMPFVGGRSLVLMNWSGSADSAQTLAHELGHAYHNTTLAERTYLQRQLPMALAETASIFCETLVVESALRHLDGAERLAMLDVDLAGSNQVVVDIHSRFLFEKEVFARRAERTLGLGELNELMVECQALAYADGLDQSTAHPYMWVLKPHYYGAHFYNWPYTYGLLFGLGLFARYRDDPERFRSGYETLLSRAGMDTAEELGAAFGLDVTDESFWAASLDVIRARIAEYERLAADVG